MAKHPDIQEKVAQEIDRVVGRDRLPSLEDRSTLPYTGAAVYEVLRYSSVAPVGLTHATMEDTTLGKNLSSPGFQLKIFLMWSTGPQNFEFCKILEPI